jgi:tetratricopeptide (TPR) repeat protein
MLSEPASATSDYSEAISLKPDFATAYDGRGNVYISSGQYDNAIADYSEAIRLSPNLAVAYTDRGLAYEALERNQDAIKEYKRSGSPETGFRRCILQPSLSLQRAQSVPEGGCQLR